MTTIKKVTLIIVLTLCPAFCSTARAQMPALELAIDADQVRFAATAGQEMRVEVYAPSGEMVFDSGAVTGRAVEWKMQTAEGVRAADGVYLVTIQLKTATGQIRKRIEQVTVASDQQQQSPHAAQATITGSGSTGRIAKFTGAATIANSIITESNGKIGIGITTPISLLHVRSATSDPTITAVNLAPNAIALFGNSTSGFGVVGQSNSRRGVLGTSVNGEGVVGTSSKNAGVMGESGTKYGVYGFSSSNFGVYGETNSGFAAVHGLGFTDQIGVFGKSQSGNGVLGSSNSSAGVHGSSVNRVGVEGVGGTIGVDGNSSGVAGVRGVSSAYAVFGEAEGTGSETFAGYFEGKVHVNGALSKSSGSFKIDHPLAPATRYLSHSFVESPDMMNIYNGNVTTDLNGEATVTLPRYFQALNRDFRYQLTVIGEFAQAMVAQEIKANRFQIRTDKPNVKVSWQVTGIRRDAWAEAHRIPVEEVEPEKEQGFYLHPELYGQSEEKGVNWGRHPEAMRQLKEQEVAPQLQIQK